MAKYCMAPAGAAWQRYYRNCGRPVGTLWQSTAWPLQGLRGKGTIETVVALQVLYGKVLHGPCRGCVAKVLWKLWLPCKGFLAKAFWQPAWPLQGLFGKVLHGPCRGCVAKVLWKLWLPCRYYMAKYCMAFVGAAWQRYYRNCGRPAGTIWQSTAWPLQGLRGKVV